MLSDISGLQLDYRTGRCRPCVGGGASGADCPEPDTPLAQLLPQLALEQAHVPDAKRHLQYAERRDVFRKIYQQLLPLMS
jgi:xylulokinase